MKYILKKERYDVLYMDLTITPHGFNVNTVYKIQNKALLPLALSEISIKNMPYAFKKWYMNRMMPATRIDMSELIKRIGQTKESDKIDYFGIAQIISFINYGRNMTDKYWITPLHNFKIDTGIPNCGLNNITIKARKTYKKLDFHKNGIAIDYLSSVLKTDGVIKENVAYNFPDICTNGTVKKAFSKKNGVFYLEKYYDFLDYDDRIAIFEFAKDTYKKHPDIFPEAFPVYEKETDNLLGYKTPVITCATTEIITLADICRSLGVDSKISIDTLRKACNSFGIEEYMIDELLMIRERFFTNNVFLNAKSFYENAGFLVETNSKIIKKIVAWI